MIERLRKKVLVLQDGKDKGMLRNVLAAVVIRGLALCLSFFTMPAYMRFFRNETVLGLWFTVLSVLNWVLSFDFGIGNGLRNHLTKALAEGDLKNAKRYLSSAYGASGVVCLASAVVCLPGIAYIDWNSVFQIERQVVSAHALSLTVKIVFISVELQLLLKLISSVLYAVQKSFIPELLSLATSAITLCLVAVLPPQANDENMVCMAAIHATAVLLPLLIATVVVFRGKKLRDARPSLRACGRKHTAEVLSLGGTFFFVQTAYMFIMNTNDYLITLFSDSAAVVEYQVYNRLFLLFGAAFSLAMAPVWSAVTKATAEKDFGWIQGLYKRLLKVSAVGAVLQFLMIPFLQTVVNIWLQEETVAIKPAYAVVFAALGGLMILNGVLSSFANGMGELETQTVCFAAGALIKVPLAWIMVDLFGSWIGVVTANMIALGIYCMSQPVVLSRRLRQLK